MVSVMDYQVGRFKKGCPLAVATMPHVESVCVGLWFPSGSRYESAKNSGASHFVEHLLFKGTTHRTAKAISEAVEGIGGYLNAFTSEEMTCYYAGATVRHLPLLLDVLQDMIVHSTFPSAEVGRERGVILEEIKMYEDQPSQVAHEGLNALLWPRHALGRSIAGTKETVQQLTRDELLAHRDKFFHPDRMSIIVAGKVQLAEVESMLDRTRSTPPTESPQPTSRRFTPWTSGGKVERLKIISKPIEQTHVALGLHGISRHDPRRFALKLASVILGENMSSRLFQIIREKYGLAYAISSHVGYFSDTGFLAITAGVENSHAAKAVQLILKTIKTMANSGPNKSELQRAKDYVTGQMWMGLESSSNQMMWLGEALLGYGRVHTPHELEQKVQAVTHREVQEILSFLTSDEGLRLCVVGPELRSAEFAAVTTLR
jgi:predicted Zn-dependent peptidase